MNKSKGFTLIELIIVIIILGILAVTAAPKFIDIQGDANKAAMKGVQGSIAGAMSITYGKSALDGNQQKAADAAISVGTVLTAFGYPTAIEAELADAAGISVADFVWLADPAGTLYIHKDSTKTTAITITPEKCYIKYVQATSATVAAVLTSDLTKC
ncbi:MAG: prepilin-type N-terminal cleavage/methylation domain-containing protein [Psychrobium sp.]|nr:prepilin-type N-terminal cleavage/methylation domain-containing protein [Psychrobium sp.]